MTAREMCNKIKTIDDCIKMANESMHAEDFAELDRILTKLKLHLLKTEIVRPFQKLNKK